MLQTIFTELLLEYKLGYKNTIAGNVKKIQDAYKKEKKIYTICIVLKFSVANQLSQYVTDTIILKCIALR